MGLQAMGKLATMTDTAKPAQATEVQADASEQRQAYRQPVLVKLGSLTDVTMTASGGNRDGQPKKGTGRGGFYQACGND